MKTIYITKAQEKELGIDLSHFPNAGPNPSVSGMKRMYWGKNALCIRQGQYVYNVSSVPDIYYRAECYYG